MKKIGLLLIPLLGIIFLSGCAKIVKTSDTGSVAGTNTATNNTPTTNNEPATQPVTDTSFFDDASPVWFFYSDSCGWCTKQKEVLSQLSSEGYRVKSMDVGKNQSYWTDYKIDGTPTFIANNGKGEKATGYKDKDPLKSWLDSNGAKIK